MPAPIVTVPTDLWVDILMFISTFRPDEVLADLRRRTDNVDVPSLDPEDEARRVKIVELAGEQGWVTDGEVEIDADARLSEGNDNGCYVSAWVWCPFEGTEFDTECEDDEPECLEVSDEELIDTPEAGLMCVKCQAAMLQQKEDGL